MKVEEILDREIFTPYMEKYSRDLLQRFSLCNSSTTHKSPYKSPNEETEELELNLGLSLGGKFGVEKSSKRLVRSSSVAGAIPFMREDDLSSITRPSASFPSIIRTTSLPTETEEEWRKRKEWQSLRRLEAKRRRCEKQRKGGDKECGDEIEGQMTLNFLDNQKVLGNNRVPDLGMPPFGLPGSAAIAGQSLIDVRGVEDVRNKGKERILGVGGADGYGLVGFGMVSSRGSLEAQRGSSSGSGGWSDSDGRPTQGSSTGKESKSSSSNSLSQERTNHNSVISSLTKAAKEEVHGTPTRRDAPETKPKVQSTSNGMEDMPCVFTKGDGPNGSRVDGILYKYGKGEEVRIMCICHGKFLSPAEFVKHAGGGDVANPRKHIFINTSTVLSR